MALRASAPAAASRSARPFSDRPVAVSVASRRLAARAAAAAEPAAAPKPAASQASRQSPLRRPEPR
jgi:hypothetical protein